MSVKNNTNFIRDILYLLSTIRNGSINTAAEQNGIKPANLSKLLTGLEETLGCKLLERSSRGVRPTKEGKEIFELSSVLEQGLEKLEKLRKDSFVNPHHVNIYISENMQLNCLNEFTTTYPDLDVTLIDSESIADVAVLNQPPLYINTSFTKCSIGNNLSQTVWISCDERHKSALLLFDFIIAKLLP